MDQETPTSSEKAVRFRAREEVAFVETVEYGGPEYATATQRRRRRRRRQHVMRNSVRSPRFAFFFCLLAIVSILFVYWLAKYIVQTSTLDTDQENNTNTTTDTSINDRSTDRSIPSSVDTTVTELTTTTMNRRCLAEGGGFALDGWCYLHIYKGYGDIETNDLECDPPYTLSKLFERGIKAAATLMAYAKRKYRDSDIVYVFAARANCSEGRITNIEYFNENKTKIDREKYKQYFNFSNNYYCRKSDMIVIQHVANELFQVGYDVVQNGYEHYILCEFTLS